RMKGIVSDIAVENPKTLDDALALLADAADKGEEARPLAGGTDIFVLLNAGVLPWKRFVNIHGIPELRGVEFDADGSLVAGAAAEYAKLLRDGRVRERFPNLAEAARWIGGRQI